MTEERKLWLRRKIFEDGDDLDWMKVAKVLHSLHSPQAGPFLRVCVLGRGNGRAPSLPWKVLRIPRCCCISSGNSRCGAWCTGCLRLKDGYRGKEIYKAIVLYRARGCRFTCNSISMPR